MRSIFFRFFSVVLKISLVSTLAQANITVTNLADSGPGSLRQAIADAAPGAIIDFSVTGTITLTSGQLAIDKNLTIRGSGAANLTISGNNSCRVLTVNLPYVDSVSVSGLTIADGYTGGYGQSDGSGIYNAFGNSLVLTDCVVTNCNSANGMGGGNIQLSQPFAATMHYLGQQDDIGWRRRLH